MLGIFIDDDKNNYMVMELVPKGSLKALLLRDKNKLTMKDKFDMYEFILYTSEIPLTQN